MRIYCGTDLIRVSRIETAVQRTGQSLLNRIWTEQEQTLCNQSTASFAVRFAAKEAMAKALGTGIGPLGITWLDFEILRNTDGSPLPLLHGAASLRYNALGGISLALSLTHEGDLAQAFCVILSERQEGAAT